MGDGALPDAVWPILDVERLTPESDLRFRDAVAVRDGDGVVARLGERFRLLRRVWAALAMSDPGHVGEVGVVSKKAVLTVPVGPLRCLATMTSATPRSALASLYSSSR